MRPYLRVGDLHPTVEEYQLEHRRYPHIAYTEHQIALILENALQPIHFRKDELFTNSSASLLRTTLRKAIKVKSIDPLARNKPILKQSALYYLKAATRKRDGKSLKDSLAVLRKEGDADPYPLRSRPVNTVLSFKSIIARSHQDRSSALPSHPSELVEAQSTHCCIRDVGSPVELPERLDIDVILNLKPRLSAAQATSIGQIWKRLFEGMKRAEGRHGTTVGKAAIWNEWRGEYEEQKRFFPRPITPPFSPIIRRSYINISSIPKGEPVKPDEKHAVGRNDLKRALRCDRGASDQDGLWGPAQRMELLDTGEAISSSLTGGLRYVARATSPVSKPLKPVDDAWSKRIRQEHLVLLQPLKSHANSSGAYHQHPEPSRDNPQYNSERHAVPQPSSSGYQGWTEGDGMDHDGEARWRADPDVHIGKTGTADYSSDWQQWPAGSSSQTAVIQPPQYAPRSIDKPSPYAEFGDCLPDWAWQVDQALREGSTPQSGLNSVPTSHDLSVVDAIIGNGQRYALPFTSVDTRIASQAATTVNPSRRRSSVKRPALPDLAELVAKRARLDESGGTTNNATLTKDAFDTSVNLAEFVTARTGQLRTPMSKIQPNRGIRLLEPEFATPVVVKRHWRENPLIQNARWYARVASRPPSDDPKSTKHVLATIELMHNVPLIAALKREEIDILDEDRPTISGADFALSPTTGILFRPLSHLVHHSPELLADITTSANHYIRVIVIFEIKSYSIKNTDVDPADEADPLTPGVLRALALFSDTVSQMNEDRKADPEMKGEVKLAFGLNGAGEVASVVRAMGDSQGQNSTDDRDCAWLEGNVMTEEQAIEVCFHINAFASRAILDRYSPFNDYISRWTDEEAADALRMVVGKDMASRIVRMRAATRHLQRI